ncbi:hypothetical protein Hdeb2414_s0326g00868681 [Helianthus debilis subsp. tardiflorus]
MNTFEADSIQIPVCFLSRYQHDSLSSSLKLPSICLRFAAVSSRQLPCSEITGHLFINPGNLGNVGNK